MLSVNGSAIGFVHRVDVIGIVQGDIRRFTGTAIIECVAMINCTENIQSTADRKILFDYLPTTRILQLILFL